MSVAEEKVREAWPLAISTLSATVLLAVVLSGYQALRDDRRADVEASLKAVAELKIEQLQNWLSEFSVDIGFLSQVPHSLPCSLNGWRQGVTMQERSHGFRRA